MRSADVAFTYLYILCSVHVSQAYFNTKILLLCDGAKLFHALLCLEAQRKGIIIFMKKINVEDVLSVINSTISEHEHNKLEKNFICITAEETNKNLSSLGIDSIAFIMIIVALEDEYNCEFPDSNLIISKMNTINKIVEVLQSISI